LPERHEAYGVVVACTHPLDAPRADPALSPWLSIERLPARPPAEVAHWDWQLPTPSGEPFLALLRRSDALLLRFADLADVLVEHGAAHARVWPHPDASDGAIGRLLLDQLLPRVLAGRGRCVLHASAVLAPRGALAFVGPSGVGKSTLAARLADAGLSVMADDALVVELDQGVCFARGAYPGLRLAPSGAGAKTRVCEGMSFAAERVPLAAIYLLEHDAKGAAAGAPEVRTLAGAAALECLLRDSYRLDASDRAELGRGFAQLSALLDAVPLFRLRRPAIDVPVELLWPMLGLGDGAAPGEGG
jgi:hypothetical protein